MAKEYKYKQLMADKGIKGPCPFDSCEESELPAFHFGFAPNDHDDNFIPGHANKSKPVRINDGDDEINCKYCGLSMYKSEEGAKDKWNNLLPERTRKLLKYTHLLEGQLDKDLGVMSIDTGEHFTFFEYEDAKLKDHFKVLHEL